jgi:hypothetical protein
MLRLTVSVVSGTMVADDSSSDSCGSEIQCFRLRYFGSRMLRKNAVTFFAAGRF